MKRNNGCHTKQAAQNTDDGEEIIPPEESAAHQDQNPS
jgi:hypothetical protein